MNNSLCVYVCVVGRGSDQEPRLPEAQENPCSPEYCQDGKTVSCWPHLRLINSVFTAVCLHQCLVGWLIMSSELSSATSVLQPNQNSYKDEENDEVCWHFCQQMKGRFKKMSARDEIQWEHIWFVEGNGSFESVRKKTNQIETWSGSCIVCTRRLTGAD